MWRIGENSLNGDVLQQEFTETFQLSKFQVKSLAELNLNKNLSNAVVTAISSASYIGIVLEDKLTVFKEDTQEILWEFIFNSNCNCVTLLDDLILIAVENPGTIHAFHIPTSKSIWTYNCDNNGDQCSVQKIFCSPLSGFFSIYAFTKEGILFEILSIETSALCKALEEEVLDEFFSVISIKKYDLSNMFLDFTAKSVFETFSQTCPVGLEVEPCLNSDLSMSKYYTIEDAVDGDFISDYECNIEESMFLDFDFSGYGTMIQIECSRDGRHVVCLNEKHMLLIFLTHSKVNVDVWGDGDIQSFTFYDTIDPNSLSVSESKIGILRKLKNDHIFEIRKFPSLEFFHKIRLSEFALLVPGKPNQDSWYVIEGHASSMTDSSSILKVLSLGESTPEARLMSLLNRRKFKEAEKYAKICNLDDEIIFKTKISCMLKDYSADEILKLTKNEQEYMWKEVESSLNKIKDVDFIKSCISLLTPEVEIMRKFLSRIKDWLAANNIESAEGLICEINQNEAKLTTYNMFPDTTQSGLSLKEFLKKDLLQFLIDELINGCLKTALIIWQAHRDELLISLTLDQVQEILNAVPDGLHSNVLTSFLKEDFLPFVFTKSPESVEIIADWMVSRIYLLEINEKESWPENGDQLASMFLDVFQTFQENAGQKAIGYTAASSLAHARKKLASTDSRTGYLHELSKNIKLLLQLKENFKCKISLTTFQDSKMDVLFAILDRINLKFLSKVIDVIARPYALEYSVDLDLTLELYIKNTLQDSYITWWSHDVTPWEEHLSLVLQCIRDTDRWVKAALLLVSQATVPWSDRVKDIVNQGLNSDHSSKDDFKQQAKQVFLKEVLLKYDIKSFPMNNDMELVYTLISYILKQNRPSALDDIKKIILAFNDTLTIEAYRKFLQFYLNQDKVEELKALLISIPIDMAVGCSHSLLKYISLCLADPFLVKNNIDQTKVCLNAGLTFIEFLKLKKQAFDQELLEAFKCMQKLLKEFNICVSLSDVTETDKALRIFEIHAQSFIEIDTQQCDSQHPSLSQAILKAKRLGTILRLQMTSVLAVLITNFLQKKMYDIVIKLCGELISSYPTSSSAKTLLEVINHFSQNLQNIKNMSFQAIVSSICHLSNLAITYCEPDKIEQCMYAAQLSAYLASFNKVTGQKLSVMPSTMKSDVYNKWKFDMSYEDGGFQLDVVKVVNFVMKLLPHFMRNPSDTGSALEVPMEEEFNVFYKPLIKHMKECGQDLVALRTMLLFYHLHMSFHQTSSSNDTTEVTASNDKSETFTSTVPFPSDSLSTQSNNDTTEVTAPNDTSESLASTVAIPSDNIRNGASSQKAFSLIAAEIKDSVTNILRRIIDKKKLDMEISIGLLSMFPNEQTHLLKMLQRWSAKDLRCIMSLGEIGTECCRVFENPEFTEYDKIYRRALLLLKQNVEASQSDIVLNSSNPDYNWTVVKEIILSPKTTLTTVFECCSAFDLVVDHVLIAFVNNLLTDTDKLFLNCAEVKDVLQSTLNKTKCALESVSSEALVVKNLESLAKKVSPYSYEVLHFIHERLLTVSANVLTISSGQFERTFALLKFLKLYERVSPPGEIELERWISTHPSHTELPPIAHKRLPFWCVYEEKQYKSITPELTSNTLAVWLRIAPLLYISKDDLVMITVKNVVTNYVKKLPKDQDNKCVMSLNQDKSLLHNLYEMLCNISDVQLSVACASWVASRMPPGPNKVCSAMIALKFSEKWHELSPNNLKSVEVLNKSKDLFHRCAIERLLYENNLSNDISLSFVQSPAQLLDYLIEEYSSVCDSIIKVCKVSSEIAKIMDVDIDEIFRKKLLKWMYSSQNANNLDETFAFDDSIDNLDIEEDIDDKNIIRAINLLVGASTINHNICESIKSDYHTMTSIQRSRLLFCMVSVYGHATVEEIFGLGGHVLEESLPLVLCASELEHFHLLYTKDMIAFNKIDELVQSILANQRNNPKVLLCCVRMCREFKIWHSEIWDILLQRLVMLNMVESLQDILPIVQGHLVHMWHYKSFVSAWNVIVSHAFKNEFTDVSKFVESIFKTILSCKCVSALDIESIWNDLKYFIKNMNGKDLKNMEPVSDAETFIRVLKRLQEDC